MALRGKITKGKVQVGDPQALVEGTEVEVRPKKTKNIIKAKPVKRATKLRPLAERLAPFIGAVKDLPPDMAENLDHYLYGVSKQK